MLISPPQELWRPQDHELAHSANSVRHSRTVVSGPPIILGSASNPGQYSIDPRGQLNTNPGLRGGLNTVLTPGVNTVCVRHSRGRQVWRPRLLPQPQPEGLYIVATICGRRSVGLVSKKSLVTTLRVVTVSS
jgi:hypothetical protein